MKISEIFKNRYYESFFWNEDKSHAVCIKFISSFSNKDIKDGVIEVTFSTTNPKKKGFRKVLRNEDDLVRFNKNEFRVCRTENRFLDIAGIKKGDSFWLKVDKIS